MYNYDSLTKVFNESLSTLNFEDIFPSFYSANVATFTEKDEYSEITLLVAGVPKDNIAIDYRKSGYDTLLTVAISSSSKFVASQKKTYKLSNDSDLKNIKASIANGILTITIPKDLEKSESGKVIIN
ncbi:MAG: Hsp20/alpha crystallin family protein [Vulcanibacillus sp.]